MSSRQRTIPMVTTEYPASHQAHEERTGGSLGSPRYNNQVNFDINSCTNVTIPRPNNRARTGRHADRLSKQAQGWYKYKQTPVLPERELATKVATMKDLTIGIMGSITKDTTKRSMKVSQAKGKIRPFKARNLNHYKTQDDDLGEEGVFGI